LSKTARGGCFEARLLAMLAPGRRSPQRTRCGSAALAATKQLVAAPLGPVTSFAKSAKDAPVPRCGQSSKRMRLAFLLKIFN